VVAPGLGECVVPLAVLAGVAGAAAGIRPEIQTAVALDLPAGGYGGYVAVVVIRHTRQRSLPQQRGPARADEPSCHQYLRGVVVRAGSPAA
jgi:hypothetical protein